MPMDPEEILSEFDEAVMKLRALLRRVEPLTENQYIFIANRLTVVGIDFKLAARRNWKEKGQSGRRDTANEETIGDEQAV